MTTSTPPTDPDSLAVLHAISGGGLSPEDAYNALEGLRNMAGKNVVAVIEVQNAKLDAAIKAQNARFDSVNAAIASLQEQLRRERAMLWAVIALLGAAVMRYLIVG